MGKFDGMTGNERLYTAGLLDAWDRAFKARDRAELIAIYGQVEFTSEDAAASVDRMLANPAKYGRRPSPGPLGATPRALRIARITLLASLAIWAATLCWGAAGLGGASLVFLIAIVASAGICLSATACTLLWLAGRNAR